jgi:2-oxoglutarate dehydrogenase E2 component (dihydrolipoamide succinyltransferase)
MSVDIVMPKMGESIMEGTILKWHKNVGDKVETDETILEISTDKVDTEVPSPESGIVTEILYKEGDTVEVGKVLARLDSNGEAEVKSKKPEEEKPEVPPAKNAEPEVKEQVKSDAEPEMSSSQESAQDIPAGKPDARFYSPLVLNIARKEGIGLSELEKVKGSGIGGRVSKKDILAFLEDSKKPAMEKEPVKEPLKKADVPASREAPAAKEKKLELPKQPVSYDEEGLSIMEFDNIRQKMAEHMVMSVHTSPHVTAIAECDLTNVDKVRSEMRKEFDSKEGFKLTYMPFICEAVVKALKDFPLVNSVIDDSAKPFKAITRNTINLGVAVAMEKGGLIVPVIKNADGKNLTGIARDLNDLAKRARIKKLNLDEIQGGTFSITNFGVFGNDIGSPIINQPQVAILGIGAIKKRPAVIETDEGDFIVPRRTVWLTLAFDHRLIDGALGGQFLMRVAHYIKNYAR